MDSRRWTRIKEIFAEAIELPEEERVAYVARAVQGDADLQYEVNALLSSHEEVTRRDLFEAPASEEVFRRDEAIAEEIGVYRLLRLIGRGGMGDVYEAERADEQFRKKVAIKVIRRGMGGTEIVRRFRYERQILAGLDHPNIARLLDGGVTEDGRPYLVMEYVDGTTIDRYCSERRLRMSERLKLFRTVCKAVQYAHSRLVVHRDLKPGNILVQDDGTPKLLDFGIAKLLDPGVAERQGLTTPVTRQGFSLMTPDYASPEQVRGDFVTTASDVYALGVILFELLTGHRPYRLEGLSPAEMDRVVHDTVPARPSLISENADTTGRLKGDVDNIVLMALRKEPERRYGSVEQFSEDIRRHLEGLPVIARDDTFWYRTEKFVRRNKVMVTAAVLVVLSLGLGLAATAWQARIASNQRDLARLEAVKAERINAFLQSMLASADPFREGRDVRVTELLAGASQRVEAELSNQPEIAAALHHTLGVTYMNLGHLDSAAVHLNAALALRESLHDPPHPDLAETSRELGNLRYAQGDYETSEDLLNAAIEMTLALAPLDSFDLAVARNDLAVLLHNTGRGEEAEALYREILAYYRGHPGSLPEGEAEMLNNLAVLLGTRGDLEEAEQLHRDALALVRSRYRDEHPAVAVTLYNLAGVLDAQGKRAEAEPIYEETVALRRRIYGPDHPQTIIARTTLANLYWLEARYDEATDLAREALDAAEGSLPGGHPLTAYAHVVLGQALMDGGRPAAAEPHIRRALEMRTAALSEDHWLVANTQSVLGGCLLKLGRLDEAERLLTQAHRRLLEDRGPEHEKTKEAERRLVELEGVREGGGLSSE